MFRSDEFPYLLIVVQIALIVFNLALFYFIFRWIKRFFNRR